MWNSIFENGDGEMKYLLILIGILNLIDVLFTYLGLHFLYITELNPLMKATYQWSPNLFLALKIGLSIMIFTISYKLKGKRNYSKVLILSSMIASAFYTVICLLHGYWILHIFHLN